MKRLGVLILIILLLVLGFYFARNVIAKTILTKAVGLATGLTMQVSDMNVGILNSQLGVKGVKLLNPKGFEDKIMVDLPELFIDYDMSDLLKKKVHLNELRLDLKQLTVVTNSAGQINLNVLKTSKAESKTEPKTKTKESPKEKSEAIAVVIDKLSLKVGKVILKDYSKGQTPSTKEFDVNIDIAANNITSMDGLVNLILKETLLKAGLTNLTGLELGSVDTKALQEKSDGIINKAKEELDDVGEGVKDFLKFGK